MYISYRSWTIYEEPVPGIRLTIMQVSPFLPHSYSEASLPAVVFHVDVENTGKIRYMYENTHSLLNIYLYIILLVILRYYVYI